MDGAPKKDNLRDRHSPPSIPSYLRINNERCTFKHAKLRSADIISALYTFNVGRALTKVVWWMRDVCYVVCVSDVYGIM
jgi:hypothetical protein